MFLLTRIPIHECKSNEYKRFAELIHCKSNILKNWDCIILDIGKADWCILKANIYNGIIVFVRVDVCGSSFAPMNNNDSRGPWITV